MTIQLSVLGIFLAIVFIIFAWWSKAKETEKINDALDNYNEKNDEINNLLSNKKSSSK